MESMEVHPELCICNPSSVSTSEFLSYLYIQEGKMNKISFFNLPNVHTRHIAYFDKISYWRETSSNIHYY